MENLNTDQVLNWALIIIALGAVAWAALQNWFFNSRNRYNQFPPYHPPYGAYPPYAGPYSQQQGADYPYMQTPRRSSPFLTIVMITIVGIALYTWAKDIKPSDDLARIEKPGKLPDDTGKKPITSDIMKLEDDRISQSSTSQSGETKKEDPIRSYEGGNGVSSDNARPLDPDMRISPEVKTVPKAGYTVQVAALERDGSFEKLAAELLEHYQNATIFRYIAPLEAALVDKLLIGRFATREDAMKGVKKLKTLGYKDCFPIDFEEIDLEKVKVYES